jgi:hypothetical protein
LVARFNGVEEVGGSNPLAPTLVVVNATTPRVKSACINLSSGWCRHFFVALNPTGEFINIRSGLWTWAEWKLQIPHIIRGNVPAPSYHKRVIPFTQDEIKHLLDAATYSVNDF